MRPIDADALVLELCQWNNKLQPRFFRSDVIVKEVLAETLECIVAAPTLDYEPVVHGEWIHDINNLYGCSVCLERETMSRKKLKKFCPNCGAKMDGGKSDG